MSTLFLRKNKNDKIKIKGSNRDILSDKQSFSSKREKVSFKNRNRGMMVFMTAAERWKLDDDRDRYFRPRKALHHSVFDTRESSDKGGSYT